MRIYARGARVAQPNYGPGTVSDADAHHTVVDFDNHGPRKFVTSMVVLESTNEPAPHRAKARAAKPAASRKKA